MQPSQRTTDCMPAEWVLLLAYYVKHGLTTCVLGEQENTNVRTAISSSPFTCRCGFFSFSVRQLLMLADACRDLTEATAAGASISLVTALTIFLLFVAVSSPCSQAPLLPPSVCPAGCSSVLRYRVQGLACCACLPHIRGLALALCIQHKRSPKTAICCFAHCVKGHRGRQSCGVAVLCLSITATCFSPSYATAEPKDL